ncbi:nuclear transport factor 2 family protein [uncultured Sphingomonas sp.]|uniref:nuclear transport factor 2 family protein n=1 Tax=uncultured Sphingomonas sp. TaxID=158754 RepID=UPI0025EF1647|nr:nuclear transport factor 2 family protein [uncultured Sphingomonas sp.]
MLLSFIAFTLATQTTGLPLPAANPTRSVASPTKLPPANPLAPPNGGDERAVLATVDRLLGGINTRDAAAIGGVLLSSAGATIVTEAGGGPATVHTLTNAELLARFQPGPETFDERVSGPAVEIDGDMAMVWAPYVFRLNGKVHHCGTNHFSLVRENGAWKIASLAWTSRTTGCTE